MAKGNNIGAVVILAILALGGLGLSGYMFIEDRFLGGNEYVPDHDHEYEDKSYKLVGLWDSLSGTGDAFNITFASNKTAENGYVTLTGGTTFDLTQQGWYKFTIVAIFINLDPADYYYTRSYRNGAISEMAGYIHYPQSDGAYLNMESYVYSEGNTSIYFTCAAAFGDSFSITGNNYYNHAWLEYAVLD